MLNVLQCKKAIPSKFLFKNVIIKHNEHRQCTNYLVSYALKRL